MSAFAAGQSHEEHEIRTFPLAILSQATSNFSTSNIIGRGGFGPVYKGVLNEEGRTVAIKKLEVVGRQGLGEFERELAVLQRCRHQNLVPLLGYCRQSMLCLVYPYMENGSLYDTLHLQRLRERKQSLLPTFWARVTLLAEVASGLAYLHGESFVHRDIKSANILLDGLGVARIGDTGLTREVALTRDEVQKLYASRDSR